MMPTAAPDVKKETKGRKHRKPRAESCYVTELYGGQAVITETICEQVPAATVCSVCVGCGVPVTQCS